MGGYGQGNLHPVGRFAPLCAGAGCILSSSVGIHDFPDAFVFHTVRTVFQAIRFQDLYPEKDEQASDTVYLLLCVDGSVDSGYLVPAFRPAAGLL